MTPEAINDLAKLLSAWKDMSEMCASIRSHVGLRDAVDISVFDPSERGPDEGNLGQCLIPSEWVLDMLFNYMDDVKFRLGTAGVDVSGLTAHRSTGNA